MSLRSGPRLVRASLESKSSADFMTPHRLNLTEPGAARHVGLKCIHLPQCKGPTSSCDETTWAQVGSGQTATTGMVVLLTMVCKDSTAHR